MAKDKEVSKGWVIVIGIIGVLLFILMITIGWLFGSYNTMATMTENMDSQWSNVKTEYQLRADLFYNLVEVTKSYATFEKDTLTQVAMARGGNFQGNQQEQMKEMDKLDSTFSRLLLVFEQYPQLKANEQYNKLMDQIISKEDRIQIARNAFNTVVKDYNIYIKKAPRNMLADIYGYKPRAYFENEVGTDAAPKIKMN